MADSATQCLNQHCLINLSVVCMYVFARVWVLVHICVGCGSPRLMSGILLHLPLPSWFPEAQSPAEAGAQHFSWSSTPASSRLSCFYLLRAGTTGGPPGIYMCAGDPSSGPPFLWQACYFLRHLPSLGNWQLLPTENKCFSDYKGINKGEHLELYSTSF